MLELTNQKRIRALISWIGQTSDIHAEHLPKMASLAWILKRGSFYKRVGGMEGCTCLVMDVYNLRNDEHLLQSVERESKLLSTIGIADSTPDGKDECCNEDTLNLWRHSLSEDIPTRLVLAKCPNLASLITATNVCHKLCTLIFKIYRLDRRRYLVSILSHRCMEVL